MISTIRSALLNPVIPYALVLAALPLFGFASQAAQARQTTTSVSPDASECVPVVACGLVWDRGNDAPYP
jgi:hypothetical protein